MDTSFLPSDSDDNESLPDLSVLLKRKPGNLQISKLNQDGDTSLLRSPLKELQRLPNSQNDQSPRPSKQRTLKNLEPATFLFSPLKEIEPAKSRRKQAIGSFVEATMLGSPTATPTKLKANRRWKTSDTAESRFKLEPKTLSNSQDATEVESETVDHKASLVQETDAIPQSRPTSSYSNNEAILT
jgi:hypothetical protein